MLEIKLNCLSFRIITENNMISVHFIPNLFYCIITIYNDISLLVYYEDVLFLTVCPLEVKFTARAV